MIKVVSQEEAEQVGYVVCCRLGMPRHFTDDAYGRCSHCGHSIFFRPNVPSRPPKICIECFADTMNGGRA